MRGIAEEGGCSFITKFGRIANSYPNSGKHWGVLETRDSRTVQKITFLARCVGKKKRNWGVKKVQNGEN